MNDPAIDAGPILGTGSQPGAASLARARGPRAKKLEQVTEAMKDDVRQGRHTLAELQDMLEKDMAATYGVSRDTARKAAAFVAGSRGTVTESSKNFFKPEISREALSDSGKNAVVESIKKRREKSKNMRKNLAIKIAQEKRKTRPSLSKRALAEAVINAWPKTSSLNVKCPVTIGTLQDFFLEKERSGELALKKVGG
jgi:hypothetical protein